MSTTFITEFRGFMAIVAMYVILWTLIILVMR